MDKDRESAQSAQPTQAQSNEESQAENSQENINAPYDTAFKILITYCSKLILPMLNEAFGENYRGDEEIRLSQQEHFPNGKDGQKTRRITDADFVVIRKNRNADGSITESSRRYHWECETHANQDILIRLFEYDAQIALDETREVGHYKLTVTLPHSAVLFLDSGKNTPNHMSMTINSPGGSISYDIPIIQTKNYSIEPIFSKELYFLIPFYLFRYRKNLSAIDKDAAEISKLAEEQWEIFSRLHRLSHSDIDGIQESSPEKLKLSVSDYAIILGLTKSVAENVLKKYPETRKGVEDVLGVTELQCENLDLIISVSAKVRAETRAETRAEDRAREKAKLLRVIQRLMEFNHTTREEAMAILGIEPEEIADTEAATTAAAQ